MEAVEGEEGLGANGRRHLVWNTSNRSQDTSPSCSRSSNCPPQRSLYHHGRSLCLALGKSWL